VTYAAAAFDFSNRYLVDPAARPTDVPYVVGANMLVRRAVIEQVGTYDPALRIAEDFDLCVRARQAGWRVVFEPRAVSEHRHPRTSVASYLRYQYKIGRYGCRFRLKHRAAVPFGRWYPSTSAGAVLLAPAYVTMALGRIVTKNVAVGAVRPLLKYFPLIALGQCFVVAGISSADLAEITKTRCWLEEIALRESIAAHTTKWEEALVLAHHRLARTPRSLSEQRFDDNPEWEPLHRAFHRALIAGCGSRWLMAFCEQLADQHHRYCRLSAPRAFSKRTVKTEHQQLMEAALEGRADAAAALLKAHFNRTAEIIREDRTLFSGRPG